MLDFLLWYILVTLIGLITFPLSFVLLKQLRDRGFAVARVLGLLIWGYLFWILGILGIIANNLGGVLFALVLLLTANIVVFVKNAHAIKQWVREHWRLMVLVEVVFLVAFGFWALVRAANPALLGTEKPMELAFINAILKSPQMPPNDPWLSGYSISYYYFGYLIVSMLIRMTGTITTVAFNLMVALLFGLVAVTSFGLLNNLLAHKKGAGQKTGLSPVWGLLAPLYILFVSNAQGLLEVLHAGGVGWSQNPDGSWFSSFWSWLDIPDVNRAPSLPFQWRPNRSGGWWWWQASRVVQDFKANDVRELVIDEFPQFSYILADLHPHVLTMPVVLLALTVLLNIFMGLLPKVDEKLGIIAGADSILKKEIDWQTLWHKLFIAQWLKQPLFWLLTLILGGIAFFNTWDFPIYLGLFSVGVLTFNTVAYGWSKHRIIEFVETFLLAAFLSVFLYLPYFLGFGSQAGGFLPSVIFYTKGIYFWIMFVSLLGPILLWLFRTAKKKDIGFHAQFGVVSAVSIVGGLWLFSYAFAGILLFIAPLLPSQRLQTNSNLFFWLQGGIEGGTLLLESLTRRFTDPLTWITLGFMLVLVAGLLFATKKSKQKGLENLKKPYFWQQDEADHKATVFVLLLVLLGVGLTLVPEFIYLLDQFGTRMNTIFKFYFQTWIVWGIAAAYATVMILRELRGVAGLLAKTLIVATILIGLIYPYFAIKDVTHNFQPRIYSQAGELQPDWSLDGALYLKRSLPDEMAAIGWLAEAPLGTVAEAIGGSYTNFARVSTYSGQPTVLGWPGHQSQWRGGAAEMGTRESDIELLYRSGQWDTVRTILDQYGIRYVFLSDLEYSKYNASTKVFDAYLTPLFVSGNVIIYGYDAVP